MADPTARHPQAASVRQPSIRACALLREDNARKGFLEPDQLRAVVAELPKDLNPTIEAAYLTG
jgi:hypothetical protein